MCIAHTLDWGIVIGATITAVGALLVSHQWKQEQVGKRKFELAEKTLSIASVCADKLRYVRSPITHNGEGETRPLTPAEEASGQRDHTCDTYYAKIERLEAMQDVFQSLQELFHLFSAYEGRDKVSSAFKPFSEVEREVWAAAQSLIRNHQQLDKNEELKEQLLSKIWYNYPPDQEDVLGLKISNALAEMEKLCGPYLGRKIKIERQENEQPSA